MGSPESSAAEIITIDVHAVKELIESDYHYLDVRPEEAYKNGHVDAEKIRVIPYFINTPEGRVKNPEFLQQVRSAFKEDDKLIVGCQTGGRSRLATADLLQAGFKHVSNMGGGLRAWIENEFPIKDETEIKIPLEKQEVGIELPSKKQEDGTEGPRKLSN